MTKQAQGRIDDAGPPRPRLVVRVGVTGHRPNRLPHPTPPALEVEIRRVLLALHAAAQALKEEEQAVFSPEPAQLRLLTSLAEGADRIAAHAALAVGAGISAPLPFPRNVYRGDFKTKASRDDFDDLLARADAVLELDGARSAESRAYEAAGVMVLRQCDILLAIWDGEPAAGRGGAPEIVNLAVAARQPVIWIDPARPKARLLHNEGEAPIADARDLLPDAPLLAEDQVDALVRQFAAPPTLAPSAHHRLDGRAHHHHQQSAAARRNAAVERARRGLEAFLREPEPPAGRFGSYRILLLLTGVGRWPGRSPPFRQQAAQGWDGFLAALGPFAPVAPTPTTSRLFQAFAWTDALAGRYGDLHRDTAVRNFTLAAVAVALSLFSVFDHQHHFKHWLVLAELAVLAVIVWRTRRGGKGRWHERWADYRDLGERLRLLRLLALTGSARVAPAGDGAALFGAPSSSWTTWYYAAILREIDLPNARADAPYVRAALDALSREELTGQIAYHRANEARMERVDEVLHLAGVASLAATVLVGLLYLLVKSVVTKESLESVDGERFVAAVTFFASLLPAIGASCLGIRENGEFRRRRDLSVVMIDRLRRLRVRVRAVRRAPSLAQAASLSETAADAMTAEVGDWSYLFRTRPLGLPG